MPGPPPKRDAERRRHQAPAAGPAKTVKVDDLESDDPDSLPFLIKQPIRVPSPESGWHPIAAELWDSMRRSGQALFWEPSDWIVAKLICESLSRDLKPQFVGVTNPGEMGGISEPIYETIPLKGASLSGYLKAFGQLMLTEGERRRLRIELERSRALGVIAEQAEEVKPRDRKTALLSLVPPAEEAS